MSISKKAFVLASALAAVAALSAGAASAKCVKAGGQADMITEDLARFMANAALNNSIKAQGLKGVGPVSMTCGPGVPINCKAFQKACN